MPRVNDVYELPPGTHGVSGTPILSNRYNTFVDDVAADLNAARPVTSGGTGGNSAITGHDGLVTKGADIASAATLNLDNATGYFVDVTGNTGISAVTLTAGRQRTVRFTGTPLITVGANLIGNNGGQNIQVEAGDMAVFEGYPSDVVRFWLTRSNGGPVRQAGTTDTLTSTDAGAGAGPITAGYRNSASPAANDLLWQHQWIGKDSDGNDETYATLTGKIITPTNGAETSRLTVQTRNGGAFQTYEFGESAIFVNGGMLSFAGSSWTFNNSMPVNIAGATYTSYSGVPISSLVSGTTTGALIESANAGHLVLGIRDNDAADSVSIVSYDGTGAYSKLVAAFKANGAVSVPGAVTAATGNFGDISATAGVALSGGGTITGVQINNSPIGGTTPSSAVFTTVSVNGNTVLGDASGDAVFLGQSASSGPGISNTNTGGAFTNEALRLSTSTGPTLFQNVNVSSTQTSYRWQGSQVGSVSSTSTTTAFNTSSDERLKDFTGVYDPLEALAIIRADPTRKFTWKVDGSVAVGWGAQTSYAVSHDLATPGVGNPGDEDYTPWGIDQGKRTPYLWAVVPWLADRLDAVEARLTALEAPA